MIHLKSVHIESEDYSLHTTRVIQDVFGYFRDNHTFLEPSLLISKHADIYRMFSTQNVETGGPDTDVYLTARWSTVKKNTTPPANFHLDRYFSNKTVSTDDESVVEYETRIAIHDRKLVKHFIIGIETQSYNTKLLFHFFSDWQHDMAMYHLYFLSKIQNLFKEVIISFSHRDLRKDSALSEKIARGVLDHPCLTFLHNTNNKRLGETTSFYHLLKRIDPIKDDYIFYAHSKGLRHKNYDAILHWVTLLYYKNMSHFDEMVYSNAVMGGCFISRMPFDMTNRFPWHYSGSFYWFSPKGERQHRLASILQSKTYDYYSTEKFPSRLCTLNRDCIDFCHTRIGSQAVKCPLYDTDFYHKHFPHFVQITSWIQTEIDSQLSNKSPS